MRVTLSLRELFLVILLVATVSLFLNIQANRYGVLLNGGKLVFTSNISYDVTDGVFAVKQAFKVVGGRSLNQHGSEMAALHERTTNKTSNKLIQRLIKLESRLMSISRQPIIALFNGNVTSDVRERVRIKNVPIKLINNLGLKHLDWIDDNTVIQGGNWSVLLCGDSNVCPRFRDILYKKVNCINAMKEFINNSSKLCELSRRIDREFRDINCHGSVLESSEKSLRYPSNPRNSSEMARGRVAMDTSYLRTRKSYVSNSLRETPKQLPLSTSGPLLRLRMLVASMTPLRLYIHPSVLSGPFESSDTNRNLSAVAVEDILQFISETYGLNMSSRWWTTLQKTLVKYLINIHTINGGENTRCGRCFLEVYADLVCTYVEHCRVIKFKDAMRTISNAVVDTLSMTSSFSSSLQDVRMAFLDPQIFNHEDTAAFLTDLDLIYLLDSRREQMVEHNWIKIYPSKEGNTMYETIDYRRQCHSGLTNQVLSNIEQFYHRMDYANKGPFDIPYDTDIGIHSNEQNQKDLFVPEYSMCSEDRDVYKEIDTIHTEPRLELKTIKRFHLYSEVPYDVITIRIWAYAKHCSCVVKLDNKYNSPGARHVTVGLGNNTFHLLVIDSTVRDQRVVSTVTLTLYRRGRDSGIRTGISVLRQCGLKQDCSLKYNQNEDCGLHGVFEENIPTQRCTSGDVDGRWLVPCTDCQNPHSCIWKDAKWQPFLCSHRKHATSSLKRCLRDKKLLFIGDSTNRGIMNYIMEQINGTLRHWDKVHSTRAYTNLNDNSAHFTFAYYPLFWLPVDHRPKFQKIIYQLIKSSLPLHNNSSTVLVVGGVQWLAREHIDSIIEALKRKGLPNITVVIKGLGAGFHQPIEGVRFVPSEKQPDLQQKENEILTYAKARGFRVVSTFNMTLARYRDFLEGKCACHFHKVTKLKVGPEAVYSISGDINAAYSNIIADQICG